MAGERKNGMLKFDTTKSRSVAFVAVVVAVIIGMAFLQGVDAVPSCCEAELPNCCMKCCRDALDAAINAAMNHSPSVSSIA